MDHFLAGCYLRRKIRFMAKSQLFKPPAQFIYSHGGVFPVQARVGRRGGLRHGGGDPQQQRPGLVAMYCEGGQTVARSGEIAANAKRGIGQLALRTGAPIVPVAIHGSQRIRNWKRLQFPKITVQYGEPFRYPVLESPTRDQQQQVADEEILLEIKKLHDGLEEVGRKKALARRREGRESAARCRGPLGA